MESGMFLDAKQKSYSLFSVTIVVTEKGDIMRTGENIHKRKDGRWEARIRVNTYKDGRPKYKYLYGTTYQDVKKKKMEYENNCILKTEKTQEVSHSLVFREAAEEWLTEKKEYWKPGTYNQYRRCLETRILPFWGDMAYDAITQSDYNSLIKADGRQGGYADILNTVLKGIMKLVLSRYHQKASFVTFSCQSKTPKNIEILTIEESRTLISYIHRHPTSTGLGILLSLHEGLRAGELCALRWQDIDLDNRLLHVRETVQRLPEEDPFKDTRTRIIFGLPKNGRARILPLHPQMYAMLEREKAYHLPMDFILSGTSALIEPRTFANRFHATLERCGIRKVRPHILRHTFASSCIEAGMDVKALSEILGHTTIKITLDRYVHLSMHFKQEQLSTLSFFDPYSWSES